MNKKEPKIQEVKKDRYGALRFGMCVEKPKTPKGDYRFNANIGQIYKKSISEAIGGGIFNHLDFQEVNVEGKQCVQIDVMVLPTEKYNQLKRRASNANKKPGGKPKKSA